MLLETSVVEKYHSRIVSLNGSKGDGHGGDGEEEQGRMIFRHIGTVECDFRYRRLGRYQVCGEREVEGLE